MKDIVMVAPLQDIYDKTHDVIQERGYEDVAVVLGNLSEGVEKARKAVSEGASLVVTRGGTYEMIQRELRVPMVELQVTAYDIIESVGPLLLEDSEVGVVGFKAVVDGFDRLSPLIKIKIVKVELHNEQSIYDAISKYKRMGLKTFIGDANVLQVASILGCRGVVVSSSKDSIVTALEYARSLLAASRSEKLRAQQTAVATNFMHEGIIAFDRSRTISIFNKAAEKIFNIAKEDAINHSLDEIIYDQRLSELLYREESHTGQVLPLGNTKIVVNHAPVYVDGKINGAVATIQNVAEMQNMEQKVRRQLADRGFSAKYTFDDIMQESDIIRRCIRKARDYAHYDSPVLILGESGVGKELFSQSIHNASSRAQGPFVAINCAAIPSSLIEAELFGYAEGSFTGAKVSGRAGIFELAHKGTVFLDEIGDLPLELQGRLLRVLQEKQIMRLGGDKIIPVDVRVLCATNKNLGRLIEAGTFRQDLFFRINVLTLAVPSLRARGEAGILVLAEYFLRKYALKYGKHKLVMSQEVRRQLALRQYRGNIRELEGLMERCVILSSFDDIAEPDYGLRQEEPFTTSDSTLLDLRAVEERHIRHVFLKTGRNRKKTCALLGINRSTLWRRLGEWGQDDAEENK